MNKKELLDKIKQLEGLNSDEKAYLLNLVNTKKKYGLVWEDKPEDVEEELRTKLPVLREVKEKAIINGDEHPNHILIEGDNLHALTALTFTHEEAIDLIYIDPPYNTGNNDFIYNDNFVDKDDQFRHSKWLSFMHKRLSLAKNLLSEDGVIFISIDDNEDSSLKLLCDEVFGETNFLGRITWFKKRKGSFLSNHVVSMTEYILPYRKTTKLGSLFGSAPDNNESQPLIKRTNSVKELRFPKNFIKTKLVDGAYQKGIYGQGSSATTVLNDFNVQNGIIKEELLLRAPFVWSQNFLDAEITNGTEIIINTKTIQPRAIRKNNSNIKAFSSFLDGRDFGATNEDAYENLKEIFNTDRPFQYSKPKELIKKLLLSKAYFSNQITVLDFMAGSGTTMHAALELSEDQGYTLKTILVTNNENEIAEKITYVRNKRVIQGYKNSKGVFVEGLTNNNLRYYQCDFVDRKPTLANKRKLTKLATELLCIKEDAYQEVTSLLEVTDWHRLFTDGKGGYVYIVYDDLYIDEAVEVIDQFIAKHKSEKKVKVYVFSNGQYAYTEEFEALAENVELAALPDAIYKALAQVLPKEEREAIPSLEEDESSQEVEN